jgi:hypothetical protein
MIAIRSASEGEEIQMNLRRRTFAVLVGVSALAVGLVPGAGAHDLGGWGTYPHGCAEDKGWHGALRPESSKDRNGDGWICARIRDGVELREKDNHIH